MCVCVCVCIAGLPHAPLDPWPDDPGLPLSTGAEFRENASWRNKYLFNSPAVQDPQEPKTRRGETRFYGRVRATKGVFPLIDFSDLAPTGLCLPDFPSQAFKFCSGSAFFSRVWGVVHSWQAKRTWSTAVFGANETPEAICSRY